MERGRLTFRPGSDQPGHQTNGSSSLGHVQEEAEASPARAQLPENIGGTQVSAAVLPKVYALDLFADDVAEGYGAQGKSNDEEQYQKHGPGFPLKLVLSAGIQNRLNVFSF